MSIWTRLILGPALALCAQISVASAATQIKVIYYFGAGRDGGAPLAEPLLKGGMLYGSTNTGGLAAGCDCGTLYKVNPKTGKLTVLHAFFDQGDGARPAGQLVVDTHGKFYGTAGSVFQFDAVKKKLITLHDFTGGDDGGGANPGVVIDKAGILYGTTNSGGANGFGTVFALDPKTQILTTLYAFTDGLDGGKPAAGLAIDANGLLYGTTSIGGAGQCADEFGRPTGCGTVFKVDPATQTFTTLYAFQGGSDGHLPEAALMVDKAGLLYGTTFWGGGNGCGTVGCGTVFRLDPVTQTETVLHSFANTTDGARPTARLTFGPKGTLYGTTTNGGTSVIGSPEGTIFKLDPALRVLTTVHVFTGIDGGFPQTGFTFDKATGKLYGTSPVGGFGCGQGCGTIFELSHL